ncbi:MAG: succinate--CoA ligase subunit alpha [Oscillospiraceae bacterium]
MSVFVDETTKVLVQGITGKESRYWLQHMLDMGTKVVAGVTPWKQGEEVCGVPVFHSVENALKEFSVDASLICVPPKAAKDAVFEALDNGIKKVVNIPDGIPLHDMLDLRRSALAHNAIVIGGNTTGVISPGKAMIGFIPYWIKRVYHPGKVGVLSRSGSLANEVIAQITLAGYGISTFIGVGGDPVLGTRMAEIIPMFENDPDTEAIVLVGEVGGTQEEEVAQYLSNGKAHKPLIAFFAGLSAPEGKKMGHAGAIVLNGAGRIPGKIKALSDANAMIANRPKEIGQLLQKILM